jgi:hypothetical protein
MVVTDNDKLRIGVVEVLSLMKVGRALAVSMMCSFAKFSNVLLDVELRYK